MRVVGKLRVPTKRSRDILQQAKGTLLESPQIRWFSRWSGGEAGPVEQNSVEAKSLNTKGQGTVRLLLQWATVDAARRGPVGQIKGYSHDIFTKEKESWKAALYWSTKGQKAACQRKSIPVKKKEPLL
jgi:hypothetical protein